MTVVALLCRHAKVATGPRLVSAVLRRTAWWRGRDLIVNRARIFRMSSRGIWMKNPKIACAVAIAASLYASSAQGFDYSRYQAADLDEILGQPRPESGVDILAEARLKIIGALVAYGEPCNTGFLKKAMLMGGIPQPSIDAIPIT